MNTTTIIILIGIALAAFNALVVIACVVIGARTNQRIAEHDSLQPACGALSPVCDLENREDSLELAA